MDEVVSIEMVEGTLRLRDQIREYMDQGNALNKWCYLDFFLGTYDGKMLPEHTNSCGRSRNTRVPYKEGSNHDGQCRILRSADHETMPYFPGQWFPKKNRGFGPPLFEAAVLALLKPWQSLVDIKSECQTFEEAYDLFFASSNDDVKRIIENIQFYHECSEGARVKDTLVGNGENDARAREEHEQEDLPSVDSDESGGGEHQFATCVREEDVQNLLDRPFSGCEELYAEEAVEIGMESGALVSSNFETVYQRPPKLATREQLDQLKTWDDAMNCPDMEHVETISANETVVQGNNTSDIYPNENICHPEMRPLADESDAEEKEKGLKLNTQQFMAYDIVTRHLKAHLRGENPPQRLVVVYGQGGTGKLAMLNAISKTFDDLGASALLAKTATSGVAATLIGGQTLHSWAALPTRTPSSDKWITHPSKEIDKRQKENLGVLWLTIDEMSMLTTPLLAYLSKATGIVRTRMNSVEPSMAFGGLNIILIGISTSSHLWQRQSANCIIRSQKGRHANWVKLTINSSTSSSN